MASPEAVLARDINGQHRMVPTSQMSFRISAYGVAIENQSVLLVPQWDGYDIPGGGIDIGETTEAALTREVFEETGLTVKPDLQHILHVTESFFIHPTNGKFYHYLLLYYPCLLIGGEISDSGFEDDEKEYARPAEWVPLTRVSDLKFYNPVDSPAIIDAAHRLLGGGK